MQLTKEDINILLQICGSSSVRIDQAQVVLNVVAKLKAMTDEIDKPQPKEG